MVGLDGVMAPADNALLTLTRSVEEETVGGFVDVSVRL
jgi:hypothetical protein